ncbi:MAG: class I SAM-dependent methyltransferase [Candidatus Binatia bacterium]
MNDQGWPAMLAGLHYIGRTRPWDNWAYSQTYIEEFARKLTSSIDLHTSDRIADIGCGTGLYAAQIHRQLKPEHPILCIDPSAEMLAEIPLSNGLKPLRASAEEIASKEVSLPIAEPLSAIIIKEAIHHVQHQADTISGLTDLLAPGGRMLIAMLPTRIDYPLFSAALRKFEELQPDPQEIRNHMTTAGLDARLEPVSFTITIDRSRYLKMVRSRYMSLLSCFTDDELSVGVEEIGRKFPQPVLRFQDSFAFVIGWKESTR